MPITQVQANSGGFNATGTQTATLGVGVTAGNSLILRVGTYGGSGLVTPTGFVRDSNTSVGTQKIYIYRRGPIQGLAGGESSWNITGIAQPVTWDIREYSGMADEPVDAVSPITTATAATASTGTTATTTAYDALALGVMVARDATSPTGPTWSGQTNGFTEDGEQAQAIAAATSSVGTCVISKPVASIGTFECTATHSLSPATAPVGATMVVYGSSTSTYSPAIVAMYGGEAGTLAGVTTGVAGSLQWDTMTSTPTLVSGDSLATGTYCLEFAGSDVRNLGWGTATYGSGKPVVVLRLAFWFPSSLPAGDVDLPINMTIPSGSVVLHYRTATQKLGLQVGAGTEVASATTVAAGVRYGIDLRVNVTTTAHTADWQLDGVPQTQATQTGTAGSITGVFIGRGTAAAGTFRADDIALSVVAGNYPLGDLHILPLQPDPAGTLTISGTAANFQTFTSNGGTLTAWNAATALANIDDLPPTIGASADGLCQITLAAADYVEIPMQTYAATPNGAVRAVRMYACGWAASATAATIGFRAYDGSAETTLLAAANPLFDNSTTTPGWVAKMYKPASGWSQAGLDVLAFRVGFSGDATPDIGIHAIMAEVAVQPGDSLRVAEVTGLEGVTAAATVDAVLDPVTGGPIAYTASAAPDFDAVVSYTIRGTPTSTNIPAGTNDLVIVEAADATEVTSVSIGPA